MRQGAQGWCTGMTLRDGMGREVGGRFRVGNTCTPMVDTTLDLSQKAEKRLHPWVDSCECMAETTTIL